MSEKTVINNKENPIDGWREWSRFVLSKLDELTNKTDENDKDINDMQLNNVATMYQFKEDIRKDMAIIARSVAVLQVRTALLGAICGFLGSAGALTALRIIEKIILSSVGGK